MRLLQGGQGGHTYIPYCFIERFESGLLIVMVDAAVPVQHRHAFPLSGFAVASVHAVVGAVVPLAGEHIETLWWWQEKDASAVSARSPLRAWWLNPFFHNLHTTRDFRSGERDWDSRTKLHHILSTF